MNGSPYHGVGRPCKVAKEDIVGVVTAVELWSDPEYERIELEGWSSRTEYVVEALSVVPHVTVRSGPAGDFPELGLHPTIVPVAVVEWDGGAIAMTKEQVASALGEGDPSIYVAISKNGIGIAPHTLLPGEERIVAKRVEEILKA